MPNEKGQPQLINVDCSEVKTGKNYRRFSEAKLEDLLGSIKKRGLIQPAIITLNNDPNTKEKKPYELVAGERRFVCCRLLKRPVRALFYENLTEERFISIQIVENAKDPINPGELSESAFGLYKELIAEKLNLEVGELDKFNPENLPDYYKNELSINDFSTIIGRNESTVRDYFAFVKLDRKVRDLVIKKGYDFGKAVLLNKLPKDMQLLMAVKFEGIKKKNLELAVNDILTKDNEDFVLTAPVRRSNQYKELNDSLDSLNRVVYAGAEYFKYSKKKFNGNLDNIVSSGLEILYEIRDDFEARAKLEGRLERMLCMGEGKKSYRNYILKTIFDLEGEPAADVGEELRLIDVKLLDEDTAQPRKTYDPTKIKALADSIKEVGQIQPCLVSPTVEGRYIVVDGNRRRRALIKNKAKKALCLVEKMNPIMRRIYQFEAAFHEQDSPDERAGAIYRWMQLKQQEAEITEKKLEKKQIAEGIGVSRDTVRRALNFVSASSSLKRMYGRGLLTYNAVCELSKLKQQEQREVGFMVYLRGRNTKIAKKVISQYEFQKKNLNLYSKSEVITGFGPVLIKNLEKCLHKNALLRLKEGDPLRASFIFKFYTTIEELEKIKSYCDKK